MQRLNSATLKALCSEPGVNVVMFGAPHGEATIDQAIQFAEAWLECHGDATFGYMDTFENVAAARSHAVRVLPTTMIVNDGEIVAWIEGRCSSTRITQTIGGARRVRRRAAA